MVGDEFLLSLPRLGLSHVREGWSQTVRNLARSSVSAPCARGGPLASASISLPAGPSRTRGVVSVCEGQNDRNDVCPTRVRDRRDGRVQKCCYRGSSRLSFARKGWSRLNAALALFFSFASYARDGRQGLRRGLRPRRVCPTRVRDGRNGSVRRVG